MNTNNILPHISATWLPIPREPRTPVIYHGPKPYHTTRKTFTLSDEVILEMRRLRETHGMKGREIQAVLQSHGVRVTCGTIYPVCNYAYRAHLVPADTTHSYIKTAVPVP